MLLDKKTDKGQVVLEAKEVWWYDKGLTADEMKLLGTLGSVLPALESHRNTNGHTNVCRNHFLSRIDGR